MKRWMLAALPVVTFLVAYAWLESLTARTGNMAEWYRVEGLLARLAAALGCAIAAVQFDRGDHMRRAWFTMGAAYAILIANALLFGSSSHVAERSLTSGAFVASAVLVACANVCTIVGALSVARAWRLAGLDLQVSPAVRWASFAGSIVVAVVIAGGTALGDVHRALGGHFDALSNLASGLGDIVSLGVLAPILLTALALRGGTLGWPWALTVVGTLGWVLFDATGAVSSALHLNPADLKPLEEAFRVWGCVAYLSAGLLQRQARVELAVKPQVALG